VDCGNGCYSGTAPRVMRSLGLRCVPIFCEPDGTFPDRQPNTADPANLTALCTHVKRDVAGLGVAFDGDGDRIAFCDETGRVLTADESVAIIAKYGHGGVGHGDKVVLDVKLSSSVWDVVQSLGAQGIRERSGHTFLKTRMITDNLKLGGEVSGHLFYRELDGGDDGLYSAILMAGIVGRHGPLSTLVEEVPHYALTPDMRLRVESPHQVLESIAEAFPAEMVNRLDGVRVQFEDGWGLARVSVTEPVMTFRFEGKDQLALRECIDRFLSPAPTVMEAVLKMLRRQGVSR
jgi:phosphomannomutase/phosphoglucomutase